MSSNAVIDAQFDRAVEIVQGLPKTGPIQTGYEEKLTMYSLYKQATVGNVEGSRPGMFDMLARAKWDAWAKHKDLDPYEAKKKYVNALLKVLSKYSDKTVARDIVQELRLLDPFASTEMPVSRSRASSSSDSSNSDKDFTGTRSWASMPSQPSASQSIPPRPRGAEPEHDDTTSEEEDTDDDGHVGPLLPSTYAASQANRPQSSLSTHRYRTPMASMMMSSPPFGTAIPPTQPIPTFETPSAFEGEPSMSPVPPTGYPTTSYPAHLAHTSRPGVISPHNQYPNFKPLAMRQQPLQPGMTPRPLSRPVLEKAIESVQAHLAALTERIESLEASSFQRSTGSLPGPRSPGWGRTGRGSSRSPLGGSRNTEDFSNFEDMGMWSMVLTPLSRVFELFTQLVSFLTKNESRSPALVIIRRLFLDLSFLLCVLATLRWAWRKSGVRRKEVNYALRVLWRAILGHKQPRVLVDRAV